MLNAVKK